MQERLLDIAVREFGRHGLEGASTRSIAAAAGAAMSSITYHYGSKEGLYLAAADHIAKQIAAEMGPVFEAAKDVGRDDPIAARAALHAIVAQFIDRIARPESADKSLFIVREQMHPTEAFERIYAGLMGNMMERMAALVAAATAMDDSFRAKLVTMTIFGQVIVLRSSRASCLRLLGHDEFGPNLVAELKRQISANIDAVLNNLASFAQERP
ncbi:MAG: CerR family C-terminal domain-containing protein [Sphingomonas sp.]|jgi:AcrR family transcriptional regulator